MARIQRVRELINTPPSSEYFRAKAGSGWRLVSVEWERDLPEQEGRDMPLAEVPFGYRVGSDCLHLEENPEELQILMVMMEVIVQDRPSRDAAQELNNKGFRTREGGKWSPPSVFELLPRLIEIGPRIFSDEEWVERRKHLWQFV